MASTSSLPPPPPLPLRPLSSATDLSSSTVDADADLQENELADYGSDTQSLTPSIWNYVRAHGRTYHGYKAGAYLFPNDAQERERLDMQHLIIKALFDQRNWFAPLKRPQRILDIGCGTGKWCIEMAKEFPKARVEGIDLSPIQPNDTPANCHFFIDDIRRKEWNQPAEPFSYIHTRISMGIFRDFRRIIQKGFNNLEPGGWMESQELFTKVYCDDGTMPPDWQLLDWHKRQDEAAMELGKPLRIANKIKMWYEQCGFVDVHEEVFSIPINAWNSCPRYKMLGKFFRWNVSEGLHAWSVEYFCRVLGWTEAEVEVYLARLRIAVADKRVHAYYRMYVVWGRKPRADEPPSQVPKPTSWPQELAGDDEEDDEEQYL